MTELGSRSYMPPVKPQHVSGNVNMPAFICRVPTGQRKLEKVIEFEWSGKGWGKVLFSEKSGKVKGGISEYA